MMMKAQLNKLNITHSESGIEIENHNKLSKASIDIDKMDSQKDLNSWTNWVEFILNALSQALKLTPKQAAALLAKENQLLIEAWTKGLKSGYGELTNFHHIIRENSIHLSNLIINEWNESSNVFKLVMNTLRWGILSNSSELVEENLNLLSKLALDFSSLNYLENTWEWFSAIENWLLIALLDLIDRHPHLFSIIVDTIANYSKGHLIELFSINLKEYYTDEVKYYESITSFLSLLLKSDIVKEEIKLFLTDKIDEILKKFEYYKDSNLKSATTTFINELWILYEEIMTDSNIQKYYKILKSFAKTSEKAVQFAKIGEMFKLLEIFTVKKNSAAPVIYKSLIFVLVDNHYDDTTRQYTISNFIKFFELSETIPVGILIEPLMKQFIESEGITYNYNVFDFELFSSLVNHPKIKLNDAIPILDILSKIYLNDIIFCNAASVPLLQIISKFIEDPLLLEYVKKLITLSLSMYLTVTLSRPSTQLSRPALPPSRIRKNKPAPPTQDDLNYRLQRCSIISLMHKIISLQSEPLNSLIQSLTLSITHQLGKFAFNFIKT